MDQIIRFSKSFQDRLDEFTVVFGDLKLLSISKIKEQWAMNLELELEADGWQAFWKIPRITCNKSNIPYPTIVLVHVCNVNYQELNALVEVIAIQGDINLSSYEYTTSLTKLWPTKQQPTGIDAVAVANVLDKFRFFYNHILMPWDIQEKQIRICDSNIQERLQLYFNIKEGIIPKNKTIQVRTLLSEIQNEFENIEEEFGIHAELEILNNPALVELNCKIIDLKVEYELLQIMQKKYIEQRKTLDYWLIFPKTSTLKNHVEYLESMKYFASKDVKYKCSISLENALEQAFPGDSILVNQGKHVINSAGILEDGVIIKSILKDPTKTILDTEKENSLIEFFGENLLIENLHMNISIARCGIITHSGQITIKNCIISGHNLSEHAIIALPGSQIILENCKIFGFDVGIYASSHSVITLINCRIFNISTAIKFFDDSKVYLFDCVFENFSQNCIYFETKTEDNIIGDENLIKSNPFINLNNCKFDENLSNGPIVVIANKEEDIFDSNI